MPANRGELIMSPELQVLSTGTTFLLHDSGPESGQDRHLIFATRDFLAKLRTAKDFFQVRDISSKMGIDLGRLCDSSGFFK